MTPLPALELRPPSKARASAPVFPIFIRMIAATLGDMAYAAKRDLGALQRLGGWKSVRMVMRYAHVNVGELSHTINAIPGGILGEAKQGKAKRA